MPVSKATSDRHNYNIVIYFQLSGVSEHCHNMIDHCTTDTGSDKRCQKRLGLKMIKMIDRGIPPEIVHKFTVENPQKWLTFV